MRRTTWLAVTITAVVLAGAGWLSRPAPWRGEALARTERVALALALEADAAAARVPTPVAAGITLGALAALLGLAIASRMRGGRHAAIGMLRRRRPVARIARRTRLAQDAVRFLAKAERA